MRFVVECYLPAPGGDGVSERCARASAAADEMARDGAPVRLVRSIYMPEDESCLLVYEAQSAALVAEAGARAGITCDRVLEALEQEV